MPQFQPNNNTSTAGINFPDSYYYPDSVPVYKPDMDSLRAENWKIKAIVRERSDTTQLLPDSSASFYIPSHWALDTAFQKPQDARLTSMEKSPLPLMVSSGLVMGFVFLVVTMVTVSPRLIRYLKTYFKPQALFDFVEEDYGGWLPPAPWLYLAVNCILTAVIGTFLLRQGGYSFPGIWASWGMALLMVTVLPVMRAAFIRLLGAIFRTHEFSRVHILLSYNTQVILAAGLLPLLLGSLISPRFTEGLADYFILGLLGIVLIYQFFRLLTMNREGNAVSFFYNILYLCTLEIIPLLLIYKTFLEGGI